MTVNLLTGYIFRSILVKWDTIQKLIIKAFSDNEKQNLEDKSIRNEMKLNRNQAHSSTILVNTKFTHYF